VSGRRNSYSVPALGPFTQTSLPKRLTEKSFDVYLRYVKI
jgi:hypothetical protein